MAPLPPPSCSESWSPAASASASSASECGSENVGRWPLEVRFNGGVIRVVQQVQARGLPPLPSALHGLLRGHGRALARRLAELQHGAEEAICKVQAAVDSAVCKAVTSWFQLPANAVRQQAKRRKSCSLRAHNFAAIIPGDSVAEVVVTSSIFNFLNIYNTLLITRLVLTWFPNPPEAIANPLSTICDPYLNLFRGIIPPLGGTLDLSPILAFLVLNVFTNTASALPAELPRDQSNAGPGATAFTDNAAEGATWRQRAQSKKAGILRKQVIAADKEKSR